MATSMDESRVEAASQRGILQAHQGQLDDHEDRIAVLERKMGELKPSVDVACEEAARSSCLASDVDPYDLVFCGLSGTTRGEVAPIIVAVGAVLGATFDEGCITGVRPGKRSNQTRPFRFFQVFTIAEHSSCKYAE